MGMYYDAKMSEARKAGCVIEECGDDVAISRGAGDTCLYIGGDCPVAYSTPGSISREQANRVVLAARARYSPEAEAVLAAALEAAGLSECAW